MQYLRQCNQYTSFSLKAVKSFEDTSFGILPIPSSFETQSHYIPKEKQRQDLKPIVITQPEGPSWTVEDTNTVLWQRWRCQVGLLPLCFYFCYHYLCIPSIIAWIQQSRRSDSAWNHFWRQTSTESIECLWDGSSIWYAARNRPFLYVCMYVCGSDRLIITVWVGDPRSPHCLKNAFDAGEDGLGRNANSLVFGCDCLGLIRYFDANLVRDNGDLFVIKNAVVIYTVLCINLSDIY